MFKRIFALIVVLVLANACTESDDSDAGITGDNFDRVVMLTNLADHIILPVYEELHVNLTDLVVSKDAFITNPNQDNLDNLRADWLSAYKTWQYAEMFNIGKAEELQYHYQMNIYPTNIIDIENNVASGVYDLTIPNNNDAVGFPALDYLIYGLSDTDTAIVATYTTHTNAEKYKTYISDIVDQMESLTQDVLSDWNTGYRDEFIASTTNTASSAVNKFVNDFIFYYEKGLRANKVGIPAGVFSTDPLSEKVEAFYHKEISKELILEALQAVQNVFNGTHFGSTTSGVGFSTYLTELNKEDVSNRINDQLDTAREKIKSLDDNLYKQVNTNNTKMTEVYDALQAVVISLKIDMLQVFNISIDYVDADGD